MAGANVADANVAVISIGERSEGYKLVKRSADAEDGRGSTKVITVDVRKHLPRDPSTTHSSASEKGLDGSHAVIQRSRRASPR